MSLDPASVGSNVFLNDGGELALPGFVLSDMQLRSDRDKIAHLLRRFGLGASEAEVNFYGQGGLSGAIEKLLDDQSIPEAQEIPLTAFRNQQNNNLLPMQGVVAHHTLQLLRTRRPLTEKMTLFWHDHFAVSAAKVNQPPVMAHYLMTMRQHAVGGFREMLEAMSKNPAMIFWLDGQFNVKGRAQENFAREVMELFTLGVGNYSEKDIQEAARAFTGWNFRRARGGQIDGIPMPTFHFNDHLHDDGVKSVLGKTGNLSGEDVLNHLCDQPQTARYLTEKIWNWFVYPNPSKGTIDKYATEYRKSGLNTKALIRAIITSEEFYSDKSARKVYKNPVDFVIAPMRQLGVGEATAQIIADSLESDGPNLRGRGPIATAGQACQSMGMRLVYPPDVAGWESGPAWITSATMVERIQFADRLFVRAPQGSRRAHIAYPIFNLIADNPTPENLVDRLISLFDAEVDAAMKGRLVDAVKSAASGGLRPQTAGEAAMRASRLIFGMPSFQFV